MILVETQYENYNNKLITIIKAFKILSFDLKSCKYEVLIIMDHNNLRHLIDMKNLSSKQI